MRESEQFDDLTTSDEQMPPPEKATMSLKDFNRGEEPAFEPIHEDDADRFIREAFENTDDIGDVGDFQEPPIHPLAEGLRNVWVNVLESLWKEFGGEGSDDEVFDFVHEAERAGVSTELLKDFLGNIFGNADEATLQYWVGEDDEDTEFNENSYSFYGVESYLLPKG